MLFELFITVYLQIQLLSNDIFSCYNGEFENNHKLTKQSDIIYPDSGLNYYVQKILRS